MKSKIATFVVCFSLLAALTAGSAFALGPSVHMREADKYIQLLELRSYGNDLTHDAAYLQNYIWYFRLGAIWPDLGRVIVKSSALGTKVDQGMVDPHNRHFNYYLLEDALANYASDPWKVAFALGCLLHNTGDLVAQGMMVQHMSARAFMGELNILVGYHDDHPGGEAEAVVEGGMEFVFPAFDLYLGMSRTFLGSDAGRLRLTDVYDYYLEKWDEFFGAAKTVPRSTGIRRVSSILADIPNRMPPCSQELAYEVLLPSKSTKAITLNIDELLRFLTGPALMMDWWNIYYDEGYYALSPTILLGFQPGQGFYEDFPNWSSKMMKSGAIQGLNHYLPGVLEEEDGRFVQDLFWVENDNGLHISSVNADSLPSTVTAKVTIYNVPGRIGGDGLVTLRIAEDMPDGEVIAVKTADVGDSCLDYLSGDPVEVEITFDPEPSMQAGANGFFLEVVNGDDAQALPFFTTDWSSYESITALDMSMDVYTGQYATYGQWPSSLKINY